MPLGLHLTALTVSRHGWFTVYAAKADAKRLTHEEVFSGLRKKIDG